MIVENPLRLTSLMVQYFQIRDQEIAEVKANTLEEVFR